MFDMMWIYDPSAWLGLLTLVVLEIVLGIDNLVFIAVLASKLPLRLQDKARYVGLGMALLVRLLLISCISWIVTLTEPLAELFGVEFSARDIIMLAGGAFLLYKATAELHDKLEGQEERVSESKAATHAFGLVVMQIVVLDAVFSLDSVITAVGMCEHVFIMMFAVIIAMIIMVWSSRPLTLFVSRHPTLVILCLSFLLMIGFSLLAEGLHIHVPKTYLYVAIGFSILIEIFNQIARKNSLRLSSNIKNSRELAASLVLRILGSRNDSQVQSIKESIVAPPEAVFDSAEKDMVSRVLQLSNQPVRSIMTARRDVVMVDISQNRDDIMKALADSPYSHLVAYRDGNRDAPIGIINKSEVLTQEVIAGRDGIDFGKLVKQPLMIPETVSVLKALQEAKSSKIYNVLVLDEFGNYEGLVTMHDIMECFSGDLPEQSEMAELRRLDDGSFLARADIPLSELEMRAGCHIDPSARYHTLAGFIIETLQNLPEAGTELIRNGWLFRITQVENNTVAQVRIFRLEDTASGQE